MNELYFEELAGYCRELLDILPIEKEVQPLDYAVLKLKKAILECQSGETGKLRKIWCYNQQKPEVKSAFTGLNTIGILTDRFTILLIKEWCLRHKMNDPAKADDLFQSQTRDIIGSLALCQPGNASLNSKITVYPTAIEAADWEEAFYQLLGVNLVLWESQEVLYIKDIASLPDRELREYLHWFSRGNLERNALIELAEKRFWEKAATAE